MYYKDRTDIISTGKIDMVSIIIVNYDVKKELFNCIESIYKSVPKCPFEIIVVDNDAKIILEKDLKKNYPKVKYIKSKKNLGFGAGNNLGAEYAKGEFLFFLNPDTIVKQDTIDNLYKFILKDNKIGIVAPLLLHENEKPFKLQGAKKLTPLRAIFSLSFFVKFFPNNPISKDYWISDWDKKHDQEVDVVPGTAFLIRKKIFNHVKGFDKNYFLYFEEFDLCKRVSKLGYKIYITPKAKIIHLWERSTKKYKSVNNIFSKSRFYYFRKHYGLFPAIMVHLFTSFNKNALILGFILLFGLFLRFYRLNDLMIFIGDQGWFYLSARDMLLTGEIPLVGIPSSVVWLRQGPLATYLIAAALYLGKYNPVAPAILFSVLDVFTIFLVYLLGKTLFNSKTGIIASAFYATSPLVLLTARMPYHTSPIPFFSCLFFIALFKVEKNTKILFPVVFFLLGLLIQLELSNSVLFFLLIIFFLIKKIKPDRFEIIFSIIGFVTGILPFIIYDFTHRFVQTFGLPLWVFNRIRLFFGLTLSGNSTTAGFPKALNMILLQIREIISPFSIYLFIFLIALILYVIFLKIRTGFTNNFFLLLLWLFIPILGFMIHAAPGGAYFPVIFPAICLLVGFSFDYCSKKSKLFLLLLLFVIGYNAIYILSSDYFIYTNKTTNTIPRNNRGGVSWTALNNISKFIVKDSADKKFKLTGGGFLGMFDSYVDNFKYLVWLNGGKLDNSSGLDYIIYFKNELKTQKNSVIFEDADLAVVKTVKH